MPEFEALPTGPLQGVTRDWDWRGGWVRAPLLEIVFNNRLSYQARVLWLWLAAAKPTDQQLSWKNCQDLMDCSTRSRRRCLQQLVEEGLITVHEDGSVIMHDPYSMFEVASHYQKLLPQFLIDENDENPEEQHILPAKLPEILNEHKKESKNEEDNKKKSDLIDIIIKSWNDYKPDSYAKIRSVSSKQMEAVMKHLKNLNQKPANMEGFVVTICKGIGRSDFWSRRVDQSGRNFSAIFGYGNPQDQKLRNVENLFQLGQDETDGDILPIELDDEEKQLIKDYKYILFEHDKAKHRNNAEDLRKWQQHLDRINTTLQERNIAIEAR